MSYIWPRSGVTVLAVALYFSCAIYTAQGGLLDPFAFNSLGELNLANGTFTIDTDAVTISGPGLDISGVVDDQGGNANAGTVPEIAVFAFDSIDIQSSANINVVGSRAVGLLSHTHAIIDGAIHAAGEDATPIPANNAVPGAGGPGGFRGASEDDPAGLGPGGGLTGLSGNGGHGGGGGFGSDGADGDPELHPGETAGPSYGDLTDLLQGGSGGGGALTGFGGAGGGGGGAVEIGAAALVEIGTSGSILAAGGMGVDGGDSRVGGGGSGGGVRLHGTEVTIDGSVEAAGGSTDAFGSGVGGGGRVLVSGSPFPLVVGGDNIDPALVTAGIDVSPGSALGDPHTNHGVVTISPQTAIIPAGETVMVGDVTVGDVTVLQEASTSQPGVELVLQNGFVVMPGGTLQIESDSGQYTNRDVIELRGRPEGLPPSAAPDPTIDLNSVLLNEGVIQGDGKLGGLPLTNLAGGVISVGPGEELEVVAHSRTSIDNLGDFNVIGGTYTHNTGNLDFQNEPAGKFNAINANLTFGTGSNLQNDGTLNLIDSTINGDVTTSSGSQINIAGTVVFNGQVSGSPTFSGTNNLIQFNGGLAPGDSPGELNIEGTVELGATNTLFIELAGTTPGSGHDTLFVGEDVILDAGTALDVQLLDGFALGPNQQFPIIEQSGALAGQFAGLGEGDVVGNFAGVDLFIGYGGGDGNDVVLYTASAALLGDMDCDGDVDFDDIDDFVLGLTNPQGYENQFGVPPATKGDTDEDGDLDFDDIDDFVAILNNPVSGVRQTVPEPSTAVLLSLAISLWTLCRRQVCHVASPFLPLAHGADSYLPDSKLLWRDALVRT